MAFISSGPMGGGPPRAPKPHPTHFLGCGCVRMSTGRYYESPKCGYPHRDSVANDDHRSPLVEFVCGCKGYCYCGNEAKLRGERD